MSYIKARINPNKEPPDMFEELYQRSPVPKVYIHVYTFVTPVIWQMRNEYIQNIYHSNKLLNNST